ncbi:MAG: DUF3311 domain-containing protein [Nocardioidaceae bacterium]|nr:DUF3311 domain-containing protein [Nocardioidaceae bacterium]NUS51769.1 DUF3311 domain-containing protein [Nocardioidaceae bacterium]
MAVAGPGKERGAPATRVTGGTGIVVGILLAVGIVLPLLVPVYDSDAPRLGGFPFFYWFQLALIPVVSLLTVVAFRLSLRSTDKERESVGLPPRKDAEGDR